MLLSLIATVVSSANRLKLDRLVKDWRSFIYTRFNSGSNLQPWETSKVIFINIEFTSFKETFCFLADNLLTYLLL